MAELVVVGKNPWQVLVREFRPGFPDQLVEVASFTRKGLSFAGLITLTAKQRKIIMELYEFFVERE